MTDEQQQHPLHGVGLESLLTQLQTYYGWQILAEQIPINCFKSNPDVKSSVKFLMKTEWAKHRLEAFYLYKFKGLPRPDDEQYDVSPRLRAILNSQVGEPVKIALGDPEFFDDPASGPVFPSKKAVSATKASSKPSRRAKPDVDAKESAKVDLASELQPEPEAETPAEKPTVDGSDKTPDPWAKWKSKSD